MKENVKSSYKINVKGVLYFPKTENGKYSGCLVISNMLADRVEQAVSDRIGKEYTCSVVKVDGKPCAGINFKSIYEVPVFIEDPASKNKTRYNQPIPFGSIVTVSLIFKEYEYKRRSGVTAYINGMIINKISENETKEITAEDIEKDVFEDEVPF